MKIIHTNTEKEMAIEFDCDCGTKFEFDKTDVMIKGEYGYSYHVTCPTCHTVHNVTDTLTAENAEMVEDYISACKSCTECKYMEIIEEGYSSYTITNIRIECKVDSNKNFPLTGYESRAEKKSTYAFAEKCSDFKKGIPYKKCVEESEKDAFKEWERKNKNYVDY